MSHTDKEVKSHVIIPHGSVRLSHSTMSLINSCERKFQLEKLLLTSSERDASADTVFGSAYGVGIQHYFVTQNREDSLYKTWLAYEPQLETDKKNQAKCINAVERSFDAIDNLLEEYEVAYYDGKAASELSFCLLTGMPYYFVGYIDLVLKNKFTDKYLVVDVKTTGLELENLDPIYKNSAQLIGYSIVVDAIAGEELAEYDVMYFVCQTGRGYTPKIRNLVYAKTLLDRLNWFLSLGMDMQRLEVMKELNIYPMRGESCLKYNRPCKYFGVCQMHSLDIAKPYEEDTNEYQFVYDLQSLIDDHVRRIG